MTAVQTIGRLPHGNRPAGDGWARALIEADKIDAPKRSEASVRAIAARIPISELDDTLVALAAYAAAGQVASERRRRKPHDPHQPIPEEWTEGEAKRAHAAYERRYRDAWTVAGERHYQRARARVYRAAQRESV